MSIPKVIIDTDAGTDDALAIFMALAAHKRKEIEVIAITTVQGNTGLHNANNNVLRTLQTANLLDQIPVYSGATKALVHPWKFDVDPFHGFDGFGDANLPNAPPPVSHLQEEHAVLALLNLTKKHSNKVVLTALGPVTNLALAIRLDPSFLSRLADIYIMGGNTTGEGNITISGEFNITCDPEAARVVFEEVQKPIHLTPWEICRYKAQLPYEVRKELGNTNSPEAELMNKIDVKVNANRRFFNWVTCDQLSMAWMIDNLSQKTNGMTAAKEVKERLATSTKQCFATIELQGSLTRGQMVIDHEGRMKRSPNLILLTDVNMQLYQRYLRLAFGGNF